MTNISSQRCGHLDGCSKNLPSSLVGKPSWAYPCNKPGPAATVPSPHHRSHQSASTLPSPQGLGHSIYQPTPGPSRRQDFTTSITYGANAGTEGGFLRRPEGGAVIESVVRGAWRRKLRPADLPSCPQGQNRQTCLLLRAQPSTPGFRGPRRATLPDAERAEEARYCGNNGHTWAGDRCSNCWREVWPRESQDCQNHEIRRHTWHRTGHTSWRGIWYKASASDCLTLGTITRSDLAVIATRVLIGGIIAHRDFNRSTAVTFGR